MTTPEMKHPGVRFPPPTLFVLGIAAGWLLNRAVPFPIGAWLAAPVRLPLGWAAVAVGAVVIAWGMLTFARARTAIYPTRPARTIVDWGPFRFSRNPMYVGLTAMMAGVGLLIDGAWVLIFIPLVLAALTAFVIRREEAYLAGAFGEEYAAYRARVRRWL